MKKEDYLEIKENYTAYRRYYLFTFSMLILLVLFPIFIFVLQWVLQKTIVSDLLLMLLYFISFGTLMFMRPYLRKNKFSRKLIYFKSFSHLVDHELNQLEVDTVSENFKLMFDQYGKEEDGYLTLNVSPLTIRVFTNDFDIDTVKQQIQKVDQVVINVYIGKTISDEMKDEILYHVPEQVNKLLLNVGFEQETKHVFFCANDIYTFTFREKKMLNQILTSLFTKREAVQETENKE